MHNPNFSTSIEKITQLVKTAKGDLPADLAIIEGAVLNTYTGELMERQTVLVKGNTIAFVGEKAPPSAIGPTTQIIKAAGKVIIPGLIDGHTHIENQWSIEELVKYSLKSGTTTIVTEVDGIGALFGYRGITEFIKMCRNQPLRFFFTIPPVVLASSAKRKNSMLTPKETARLLHRREVLGLGELPWIQVIENDPRLLEMMAATINAGKKVEGHSAGARNNKLQAYFASGASSCHEPITAEEVLERLRMGAFVLIREGVVRKELTGVAKIKDAKIDFSLLGVCSDGVDPEQLINNGYMDFIVQKLIDHGFNPVLAIQMASINVARHFGLDFLGGIAPGKLADIAVIPDLRTIKPECVILNGKITVRESKLIVEPEKPRIPRLFFNTIRLKKRFSPESFNIRVNRNGPVKVRLIDQVSDLLTREAVVEMPAKNGLIEADISRDILKVAVIDRYWEPGKFALGLIRGFGLQRGAVASSALWDGGNIGVIGVNNADMALAVNRIKKMNGGTVVCAGGKVLAELPLPVAGTISDQPMETIAGKYDEIQRAGELLGTKLPVIQLSLHILATPFIPFFRISETGLFDLANNEAVSFVVE